MARGARAPGRVRPRAEAPLARPALIRHDGSDSWSRPVWAESFRGICWVMRSSRPLAGLWLVLLVAALLTPAGAQSAGAQSGWKPVADPKGLFTIRLPADWKIADSELSDVVFHGLRSSAAGQYLMSTLAAHSPAQDAAGMGILAVAAVGLPRRVAPAEFGAEFKQEAPSSWTVTQEGPAQIAGRAAYYVYFIMSAKSATLYMVIAYFTVGQTGFLVMGGTMNDPAAIKKHFTTISKILETFQPNARLGASLPAGPVH